METVLDYFIRHAEEKMQQEFSADSAIYRGIQKYLAERNIADTKEGAQERAESEWRLFKIMPPGVFADYFSYFEKQAAWNTFSAECEELAIDRLENDRKISREIYLQRVEKLYDMAAEIVGVKSYAAWLSDRMEKPLADLKFAYGESDEVQHDTGMRYLVSVSREK